MAGFFGRLANMIDEEISKASEEAGATTATKTEPKKPMMWNEFLEQTGKDMDEQIIRHARKEGLIYVGGKCKLTATKTEGDTETFVTNVDV